MLPSENELAKLYGTTRMTVRKSLQTLENEGLVYANQGKGYFVDNPVHDNFSIHFSEEERGYEVVCRDINVRLPDEDVRAALEIPAFQSVIEVCRIIKKKNVPVALDVKYIPYEKGTPTLEAEINYAVFPEIAAAKTAPFMFHTRMEIGAELPDETTAHLLQCKKNAPLLVVYRWLLGQDGWCMGYGIKYMLKGYGRLNAKSGYEL